MDNKTFAIIKNNIITNLVASDDPDAVPILKELTEADAVVDASNFSIAFIGAEVRDGNVVPRKPFDSWIWDEASFSWQPPKPMPVLDNTVFVWDNEQSDWIAVPLP